MPERSDYWTSRNTKNKEREEGKTTGTNVGIQVLSSHTQNWGYHSLMGQGRWFWQCCPPAPQPGIEIAVLLGARWPDSCTPRLLTSLSALCTHSTVLTIRKENKIGLCAIIHPKTLGLGKEDGLRLFFFGLLLPPFCFWNRVSCIY